MQIATVERQSDRLDQCPGLFSIEEEKGWSLRHPAALCDLALAISQH